MNIVVQILGITKEKIVYIIENISGKEEIRFHHIQYGNDDIDNLCQFYDFENGFRKGNGKRYGQYIYCLTDDKLCKINITTEEITPIDTDAKKIIFDDEYVILIKKEDRWKNYIITPPSTQEVFACNLFTDETDESIFWNDCR